MPRRLLACLALLLTLLAGCASVPHHVEISRDRLQSALQSRFPYDLPAGLFNVQVGVPQLRLLPQDNRLQLEVPIDASGRLVRSTLHGELAVSFGLRYQPSDHTLRMAAARVDQVRVQGVPASWREPLQAIGGLVAAQVLENAVLHTFDAQEVARARGWQPGNIHVTSTGVDVELLPPGEAPAR